MDKASIVFNLPAELITRAEAAGLLTDEALENWLKAELEREERANRFIANIDKMAASEPIITPEEIDAEIAAYHAEIDAKKKL